MRVPSREDQPTDHSTQKYLLGKTRVVSGVSIALIIFTYASFKLIYIAIETQPDCVPHVKGSTNDTSSYIAAKSSC